MKPRPSARWPQAGGIHSARVAFLGSAALLVVLLALLFRDARPPVDGTAGPLLVYCAAGIKPPVEAIARAYERESGVPVQLQFGSSQNLLANLEVSRRGDLFLPADDSFLELARARGLVAETLPIARMTAILAVRCGNPKRIATLADLQRADVRLAQGNPDVTAIGKLTRAALQRAGQWDALARRTVVFKPTVNDVANDLKLGAADAGFLWDALLRQYPELEAVPVPALTNAVAHVAVGVLRSSAQPGAARRLARYLVARDHGQREWERHGYEVLPGTFTE